MPASAVPSIVLQLTLTGVVWTRARRTVNDTGVPSSAVPSSTVSCAPSSSTIVPVADDGVPSVAPAGAESATVNVSSLSVAVSPRTGTTRSTAVAPAARVTVPAAAV